MGKPSAAYAAEATKAINSLIAKSDADILLPKGCVILLFGVSAKSKKEKPKTLRSLRLE
jgi:hypothetical protein